MTDKLSKAEKRQLRKKEKEEKRAKSVKIATESEQLAIKTLKIAPIPEICSKVVKIKKEELSRDKTVYLPSENTFSRDCNLTWCTTRSDKDGEWSWKEQRNWTSEEWNKQIFPSFSSLEKSTWSEILFEHKTTAKGGKNVRKHHSQELYTLVTEAQARWVELGLEEFDTAFRFRFAGTIRAWGIKLQGHFYLVWWERQHKIYPVSHS